MTVHIIIEPEEPTQSTGRRKQNTSQPESTIPSQGLGPFPQTLLNKTSSSPRALQAKGFWGQTMWPWDSGWWPDLQHLGWCRWDGCPSSDCQLCQPSETGRGQVPKCHDRYCDWYCKHINVSVSVDPGELASNQPSCH